MIFFFFFNILLPNRDINILSIFRFFLFPCNNLMHKVKEFYVFNQRNLEIAQTCLSEPYLFGSINGKIVRKAMEFYVNIFSYIFFFPTTSLSSA